MQTSSESLKSSQEIQTTLDTLNRRKTVLDTDIAVTSGEVAKMRVQANLPAKIIVEGEGFLTDDWVKRLIFSLGKSETRLANLNNEKATLEKDIKTVEKQLARARHYERMEEDKAKRYAAPEGATYINEIKKLKRQLASAENTVKMLKATRKCKCVKQEDLTETEPPKEPDVETTPRLRQMLQRATTALFNRDLK